MTRHIPAFTRTLLLLCVMLLLGTAIAQEPLPVPTAVNIPTEPSPEASPSEVSSPETSAPETPSPEAPSPESTAEPVMPADPTPVEPLPVEPTAGPIVVPDSNDPGRFDPDNLEVLPDTPNEVDTLSRGSYDGSKLDGLLAEAMERFMLGDFAGAEMVTRDHWLPRDRRGRYMVIVWPAAGAASKGTAKRVAALGGKVESTDSRAVYARLDMAQIAMLSTDAKIGRIEMQPIGRAEPEGTSSLALRAPAGTVVSEGFDVANALSWHKAGNTGASIDIAIIDFGFGTSTTGANPELSCITSYPDINLSFGGVPQPTDIRRGLDMAEIICDLAPGANIRLYKVTTGNNLFDAITSAKNNNDIIVIGAEFGANFSPGDGTFGSSTGKNVYQALATAKASGVTIIAAAGNSHDSYHTFRMDNSSSVTVTIKAKPGDQVNVSWNDWDSNPNGGNPREDMTITLSGAGFSTITKAARGVANPVYQVSIPSNCAVVSGFCTVTMALNSLNGSTVDVQVNVTGGIDRQIVSVTGANVDLKAIGAGTLSRPADSPHVIAVGAVCSYYEGNFPRESYSARGPIYGPGGSFSGPLLSDFFGPHEVKPEIVGPANVSVFNSEVSVGDLSNCVGGFRGTQASAAHVAGMTALLLNNGLVSGFSGLNAPLNILHYWRTHSADLPLEGHPKGYDMLYGAGLAVLGMPDYDYDKSLEAPVYAPPNRLPPGVCTNLTYVGPRNAGDSDYDGTVEHPFQSIAHAAHVQALAGGNRCVIVLPGEYVTPILIDSLSSSVGVFGYSGVTLNAGVDRTTIVLQNKYHEPVAAAFPRRAGLFVNDSENLMLGGFNFVIGDVYNLSAFRRPTIVAVKNTTGFSLIRSRFNGLSTDKPLVDIFDGSHGAVLSENRFINNKGLSGGSVIAVYNSGTNASRVSIRGNRFEGNINNDGSWPMISVVKNVAWVPMIRSLNSYTDIVNNTMIGNTAEALLQGVTTAMDMPYEFRVMGNAIVNNTLSSVEFTPPGPLIHGFYQRYIMIVNNTITENKFVNSGTPFNTLFGRGDHILNNAGEAMNGSMTEQYARWEIHGNLIANNGSSALAREMDLDFLSGAKCIAFADIDAEPYRGTSYNWVFDSYEGSNSGDCHNSLTNLTNHNILSVDPASNILGGANPNDPEYWAPNGTSAPAKLLKDAGPTTFITPLLPAFAGIDVRGDARINNAAVDIGAYEYTNFEIFNGGAINIIGYEDAGVVEFDISDPIYITGGFPPYTAQLVDAPDYYGTECDSRFASPGTQGSAVEAIDEDTLTIAYCPPHQFHTASSNPDLLLNPPQMIVDIFDAIGNSVQATITYTINPVDDEVISTHLEIEETVALNQPASAATNQIRLRPYVDFSENTLLNGSRFYFSERLNPVGDASAEADYDFVYTEPVKISGDSQINDSNVSFIDAQRGIIGVNLAGVNPPPGTTYSAIFEYTVKDSHNGTPVVNQLVINAVPAPEPFVLLAPTNGFSIGNIDSFGGFTWEVSTNAQTYDLVVARKIEPPYIEIIRLTGLTPQDDADGLSCSSTCALTLTPAQKMNLINSGYRWAVYADNQGLKVRSTDQFDFIVEAGRELLLNGGFEAQGTSTKLAANWDLKNGTKEKRVCTGGDQSSCFFNFSANTATVATLVQKLPGVGRKGDVLTLSSSIKTTSLSKTTGVLIVVVKYATGDKDKIALFAPSGSQNFALASANPLALRFPVASYKVKLQIKKGSGKMALDNVSLNLDEKAAFNLLTPSDGTISANAASITELTWQSSASAPSYQVLLIETLNPGTPVINATRTSAADADNLTCSGGRCVLTLAAPLPNGDYVWTVTASNGQEADNAPFAFTIDSINGTELVINNGFEVNNGKSIPGTWRISNPGKSLSVCETATTHPQYQGDCAFSFMGGSNTTISQVLSTIGIAKGTSLTLSAAAETQQAIAGGLIKLKVVYNNGSKDTRKITLGAQSRAWQTYDQTPLVLTNNVSKIVVSASYKGSTGKVLVDNVSVIHSTP